MPAFSADMDQMTSIAARLTGVVSSLDGEAHGGFDTASLGHPAAVGALEHFLSNWSHGRAEISAGVKNVHGDLVGSSANYTMVETKEAAAYRGAPVS